MTTYVAQVSSLYPIDLAAALYAGISEKKVSFRVFLSDVARIPSNPNVRKFVARAALPTGFWSYDNQRVWRQHHIPLDVCNLDEIADLLIAVANSLVGERDVLNKVIIDRCKQLANAATVRAQSSTVVWQTHWAPIVAGIVEEIFEQVLDIQIKVEPYWQFRLGQYNNDPTKQVAHWHVLQRLLNCALKIFPCRLVFIKGGHIEVEIPHESGVWQKFYNLGFDGNILELGYSEKDEERTLSIDINHSDFLSFRFRGPLEILQLQEFGTIVDLPWYADAHFWWENTSDYTGVEFISPISVNSIRRTSSELGGGGYRLSPTGYSLLEFNSAPILTFVQDKLNLRFISIEDLADWRQLINRYPWSAQKLSKHQRSVRAFRNLCEIESKRRICQGDASHLRILHKEIGSLSPLLYGKYLTEMISIVTLLKEWSSPVCPNPVPPAIIEELKLIKWINTYGVISPDNIISPLKAGIQTTQDWLELHGWSFTKKESKLQEEAINVLKERGSLSITMRRDASPAGFGLLMRVLRALIDDYYSFAAFCCGSIFKAHILFPFLILGPNEYRAEIERILTLRGEKRNLFFDTILWNVERRNQEW